MAKKRLTPNQAQFYKEIKRINRIEKQIMSKGGIIPTTYGSTPLPKRVTKKTLATLKSIKPSTIKKQAQIQVGDEIWDYTDWEKSDKRPQGSESIGEVKELEIKQDEKAEQAVDNMFDQFRELPKGIGNTFGAWFFDLLQTYGQKRVGFAILSMPIDVANIWMSVGYDYQQCMVLMEMTILNNLPPESQADMEDAWEQSDASWGEI